MTESRSKAEAWLLGLAVFAVWLLVCVNVAPDLGLHIDEGIYTATDLARIPWFAGNLDGVPLDRWSQESIRHYWGFNEANAHPFMLRFLNGLCLFFAGQPSLLVARLPSIILSGLLVAAVAAVLARYWGYCAAAGGTAFLAFNPRVFVYLVRNMHEPLLLVSALLTGLAVWRARSLRGYLLVALGSFFLFASKINALVIVAGFIIWACLYRSRRQRVSIFTAVLIGLAGYVLLEPMFWYDRLHQMNEYLQYHFRHETFRLQYFGTVYEDGRSLFLYPVVALLSALPLGYLLFFLTGVLRLRDTHSPRRELLGMSLLQVMLTLLAAISPATPKYAGIRLLLSIFPFAALLAGAGFGWLLERLERFASARLALLAVLVLPLIPMVTLHPYQVLYASELFGGAENAYRLGFETEGEMMNLTPAILNDASQRLAPGASLAVSPAGPHMLEAYTRLGYPRPYRRFTYAPTFGDGLLLYLGHNGDREMQALLADRVPDQVYAWRSIPLITFYHFRRPDEAAD